ncbi:hypothetical protein PFICI_11971 [Pestalotiopsis fici W106-1]|uniref:Methyltransferase domain-containing protein n=1 Tax=Pestalotiopsis fici (strain W106-1 / CGMCC3.15140) TaxID=1229662 RepID=W3WRX9_PESFW|nr:uncharacterized protein PFICI_11971 [Pestalotiopsis fici W106-1]ETS76584.1 hypothetical protein PFICI_11971 [Pestalotiopsis fici W106-1]
MHHFWTQTFGYVIHPKIPVDNIQRIADVGTGTSIWLFDALRQVPGQAQLDGFDISLDASPPPEVLPANVKLHHWDVKQPVPEGLDGVFDVIHLRFFAFVLMNDEIPGVIAKIFQMLKPGGHIQWEEADMETLRFDKAKPESKTDNLEGLFKLLLVQDPRFKPTWANNIHHLFSEAGFVDIEKDTKDAPPHIAFQWHECGLMIHELIARKTKNEFLAGEVKRLLPLAVEETKNGAYGTSLRFTVVARKP